MHPIPEPRLRQFEAQAARQARLLEDERRRAALEQRRRWAEEDDLDERRDIARRFGIPLGEVL
ncbi:MAG: hypothetical protein ABR569_01430 [Gaiellaceae bacterium]